MKYNLQELRQVVASATGTLKDKLKLAADCIRRGGGYSWVGLFEVTPAEIGVLGWSGVSAPATQRFPKSSGLNGAAVASRSSVLVQDVTKDPRYQTTIRTTRSEMIVPIRSRRTSEIVGTIDVANDRANAFTDDDKLFLEAAALVVAPLWH